MVDYEKHIVCRELYEEFLAEHVACLSRLTEHIEWAYKQKVMKANDANVETQYQLAKLAFEVQARAYTKKESDC